MTRASKFFASSKACLPLLKLACKQPAMDVLKSNHHWDLTSWSDLAKEATRHFAKLMSTCIPLEPDTLRKVLANQSHCISVESRDCFKALIPFAKLVRVVARCLTRKRP